MGINHDGDSLYFRYAGHSLLSVLRPAYAVGLRIVPERKNVIFPSKIMTGLIEASGRGARFLPIPGTTFAHEWESVLRPLAQRTICQQSVGKRERTQRGA